MQEGIEELVRRIIRSAQGGRKKKTSVTKGFTKGEALRLLRTNSSQITFEENMRNFSTSLKNRDYPATTVEKPLSEVIFPGHFPRQKKSTRTEKQKCT